MSVDISGGVEWFTPVMFGLQWHSQRPLYEYGFLMGITFSGRPACGAGAIVLSAEVEC